MIAVRVHGVSDDMNGSGSVVTLRDLATSVTICLCKWQQYRHEDCRLRVMITIGARARAGPEIRIG